MRQSTVALVSTLAGTPLVIAAALFFSLRDDPAASWGPWPVVVLGLVVVGAVAAELIGYRTPALPLGTDPEDAARTARQQWQTTSTLRFVLSDVGFVITIGLAFVVRTPQPALLVLGAAVLSAVAIVFHTWPWSRPVGKIADALEADGVRTGLREELGGPTAL